MTEKPDTRPASTQEPLDESEMDEIVGGTGPEVLEWAPGHSGQGGPGQGE